MKQVILDYRNGDIELVEVPAPALRPGGVLVRNVCSAVSVGTEKLMADLARKSLLGKARARPDLVRQVIAKARNEGILEAYRAAMARLDTPVPLGYSCAGHVLAVGQGVTAIREGDPVACFGSGYAAHAEVVWMPMNLCVAVPKGLDMASASLAGPGAIALHAVRLAEPTVGERVVVIGLGLLGLMAVQVLTAAGARVFGVDLSEQRLALARQLGADAAVLPGQGTAEQVQAWTRGRGADSVLVLASTDSAQPVELAAEVARDRAVVVVPGMVNLKLPRRTFYEKELRLVVSRSAGPGIYDTQYQEKGVDYPLSHVRWTAQRNMEEFLELVANGKVRLEPIITHRYSIDEALTAYDLVYKGGGHIGVVLSYPTSVEMTTRVRVGEEKRVVGEGKEKPSVGLVGAGLFAKTTLLPILKGMKDITRRSVATASGLSARHAAKKFGFQYCSSNYPELIEDADLDCVLIATRHHLHASMTVAALAKGKDVFLEKPLATTLEDLRQVAEAHRESKGRLMVGFNRRFSPFSVRARQALERRSGPLVLHCRVNAGSVPRESWVVDPVEGAGRVIGEVCHFVDLVQYLAGASPTQVYARTIQSKESASSEEENLAITLALEDGSVASITYVAMGDRAFPRERVEVFWESAVCAIDNFKSLTLVRSGKRSQMRRWNVDRGHRAELEAFFQMVRSGGPEPVPFEQYVKTTLTTFAIVESLKRGGPVEVDAAALGVPL
ncbi:MAG: bi-domain-containing oxidoreductase [Chloroflexi bacterium]|nr:bi-domain-containing oxidoreductase [Chloroflexota bacterium]